nr:MAG TPA: hypothetical protein [Caudoviricetes sp.]
MICAKNNLFNCWKFLKLTRLQRNHEIRGKRESCESRKN